MSPPDTPDGAPGPEDGPQDDAEDAPLGTREDIRKSDIDARIYQRILRRERHPDRPPDTEDMSAMDLPLDRLLEATVLFQDFAHAIRLGVARWDDAPRAAGLNFLADTMHRDAVRLYRLLHGRPPEDV